MDTVIDLDQAYLRYCEVYHCLGDSLLVEFLLHKVEVAPVSGKLALSNRSTLSSPIMSHHRACGVPLASQRVYLQALEKQRLSVVRKGVY